LKTQWQTQSEYQLARNSRLREMIHSIDKDVPRTDRHLPEFKYEDSAGLTAVRELLLAYLMLNFDLGYVQGMNDIASALWLVFRDEALTFWAFAHWMEDLEPLYAFDQHGIENQLKLVSTLVRFVDPHLMHQLERANSTHFLFCLRWLLVFFKRDFDVSGARKIWEVRG
ncbi:uncharacterized protein MONBRDRAFT_3202, partial [Monosiga brevicollis MX1]